jgi:Tfp pilus assembly protein PilZ
MAPWYRKIVLLILCQASKPAPEWSFMTSATLMEKPLGRTATLSVSKKASARVAFLDMKEPARAILSDCFRQFGIEAVLLTGDVAGHMKKEKFEACVLKLNPETETVLESARSSASNSRMVIYVLGGSAQEAMRYSKYGINAVFQEPLERPAALKLVRATRMLVFHEFRRYVRIPVITEITVTNENHRFTATSKELSCGGMSMASNEDVSIGTAVEISFALLTLPRIWVRGTVSWRKPNKSFGVRFDPNDNRRLRIKDWVEAYLET